MMRNIIQPANNKAPNRAINGYIALLVCSLISACSRSANTDSADSGGILSTTTTTTIISSEQNNLLTSTNPANCNSAPSILHVLLGSQPLSSGSTINNKVARLSGLAQPHQAIEILHNNLKQATLLVPANGQWYYDLESSIETGLNHYTAQCPNNTTLASTTFTLSLNSTLPSIPLLTSINPDTGSSHSDFISSDNSLIFNGSSDADSIIQLQINGTAIGNSTANSSGNWSFNHQSSPLSEGSHTLTVSSTNASGTVSNNFTIRIDNTAPSIAIATDDNQLIAGETATISFVFSEAVSDFTTADISLSGGTLSALAGSGANYTTVFTPTPHSNTAGSISVGSATFSDSSGNTNTDGGETNNSVALNVDTLTPTIALTASDSNLLAGEASLITFTLSEAATDFVLSDINFNGGTLGGFSGSGTSYTVLFTPFANSSAAGSISIASNAFSDAAGNPNIDAADANNSVGITVNTVRPTLSITADDNALTAGETATITVTLSEAAAAPNLFALADLSASGGTLSAFAGSGTRYTTIFTPTANSTTAAAIAVTDNAFTNAAGNANTDGADVNNMLSIAVNTVIPSAPVISGISSDTGTSSSDQITNDNTLLFTGTGATGDTILVKLNATALGTTNVNGAGAWQYDHRATPLASNSYTLSAQAQNAAGNTSSATLLSFTVDTIQPSLPLLNTITADTGNSNSDKVTRDNQVVFRGTAEKNNTLTILLNSSSIGSTTTDNAGTWVLDHTATTLADNTYNITLSSTDTAGNVRLNTGAYAMQVDTSAPTIALSTPDTSLNIGDTTTISFILSESSADFDISDISFTGGTLSDFMGSGSSYSVLFTPAANSTTPGTIHIANAAFSDTAGNTNADALEPNNNVTLNIDTIAPTISLKSFNDSLVIGETTTVTFTLSETATDFTAADITVSGGTLGALTGSGTSYSAIFTPTANSTTAGNISVASGAFSDAANNLNTDGSDANNTANITIDTEAPNAPSITAISTDTGSSTSDGVTSDQTLIFNGKSEFGNSVEVFINGVSIGTTASNAMDNWSLDHTSTTLAANNYAITARASDGAGNTGSLSMPFTLTIDTLATVPSNIQISNDTGTSSSDGITSDQTLIFTGNTEKSAVVNLLLNGSLIGSATANQTEAWSFDHTGTTLNDGSYSLAASSIDLAGNTSSAVIYNFKIDATSPVPPAVILGISDDTGTSNTDNITSDQQLVFNGTAEPLSEVSLALGSTTIGTVTTNISGNWSVDYTGTTLSDSNYTLIARARSQAGNTAPPSTPFNFTVDTSTITPNTLSLSDDTGINTTDRYTSDATLVFSGKAEAGATVTVTIDGAMAGTATANTLGNWSYDHSATTLSSTTHSVKYQATDIAGNTSTALLSNVTIDTTPPPTPVINTMTTDTGTSNSDGITSDDTLTFSGTTEATTSTTRVTFFIDGTKLGLIAANPDGSWSYNAASTTSSLSNGAHTLSASVADLAGNSSIISGTYNFTIDRLAPSTPQITSISDDLGSSASDYNTSDNTLIFSGTGDASATIHLSLAGSSIGTTTSNGTGNWTFDHSASPLADGSYLLSVHSADPAGNTSAVDTQSITIKATPPATPTLSGISTDSNIAGDYITNDNSLSITGNLSATADVNVWINGSIVSSQSSVSSGAFVIALPSTLSDGSYILQLQAVDPLFGTAANTPDQIILIDTQNPSIPTLNSISNDSGISNSDRVTNDQNLIFTGTAEAGTTVNGNVSGLILPSTTTNPSGNWTLDAQAITLPTSVTGVSFTASDLAGNSSTASAHSLEIITSAAASTATLTGINSDTGASSSDMITSDRTLIFIGTGTANTAVELSLNSSSIGFATVDSSGNWSFDYRHIQLPQNSSVTINNNLTLKSYNTAGILSATTGPFTIAILGADKAPPPPTILSMKNDTGVSGDNITSDNTLQLEGATENENDDLYIQIVGTSPLISQTINDAKTNWKSDLSGSTIPDGTYTIIARITSEESSYTHAVSAYSEPFTITIDTSVGTPTVTSISNDNGISSSDFVTNDSTLILNGTSEPNSKIDLTVLSQNFSTTADSNGKWSIDTTSVTLGEGASSFSLRETDPAGNVGTLHPFSNQVDTIPPSTPSITSFSDDTGTAGDNITSDQTLSFQGSSDPNEYVTMTMNNVFVLGTVQANGTGNWTLDYTSTTLAAGTYQFTATSNDLAGNASTASAALSITITP